MIETSRFRRVAALTVALGLVVASAACSTKGKATSSSDKGGIKTDVGVSASTITLGSIPDLSGPFAANGQKLTNAEQLFFDQLNQKGGICGRKVAISVSDSGYDVQKATVAYSTLKAKVLGFPQIFGSAINAALLPRYATDKVLVYPASGAGSLLASSNALSLSTYDYEIINLLDFWLTKGIIKPGETIGHIGLVGDFANTGFSGSERVAKANNLTLRKITVAPTDTDLTAQISSLKAAGAKAILVSGSAAQLASVAVASQAAGLRVPIGANGATFSSTVLQGPAAAPLLSRLWLGQSWASAANDNPAVTSFVAAYKAKYPGQPIDSNVTLGLTAATVYSKILQRACTDKDLTRQGVLNAQRQLTQVDTGGLISPLDFSRPGRTGTAKSYILRPSATAVGGVTPYLPTPVAGKDVAGYAPSYK